MYENNFIILSMISEIIITLAIILLLLFVAINFIKKL